MTTHSESTPSPTHELFASDKVFRRFIELANDVVYAMDLKGTLQYVSPKWTDIFGTDSSEIVGQDFTPLIHPDDLPICLQAIQTTVMQRVQQNDIRYRIRHAGGKWEYQSSNIAPLLDDDGQLIGVMGIGRDINVLTHKQAELDHALNSLTSANQSLETANIELDRHRQHLETIVQERTLSLNAARSEAESANAVKSSFMANVSHEMRTPLQAILGYSEVGKLNVEDAGREELASYFDSIQAAGDQMHKLVENLLTLASKSWDDHASWDYSQNQNIDVADFAHAVGTLMELRARKLGQTLTSDIQLNSATMRGDPARLQQVFEHLLGNALRYSGTGSNTIWRVSKSLLTSKSEPACVEFVQFEIIDQGCGIPENEIKVVFEPFYQSTRTGTGAGGTGLGLPLSQCIVARHGGSIKLENRTNRGLHCQVLLPLAEVPATA